jgi:hypothetical protein
MDCTSWNCEPEIFSPLSSLCQIFHYTDMTITNMTPFVSFPVRIFHKGYLLLCCPSINYPCFNLKVSQISSIWCFVCRLCDNHCTDDPVFCGWVLSFQFGVVFCEHFRTYRLVNEHSCAFFLIIQLSLHIQGDWFQDPSTSPQVSNSSDAWLSSSAAQYWMPVAHAYNPSYSGGRHQEDCGSKLMTEKGQVGWLKGRPWVQAPVPHTHTKKQHPAWYLNRTCTQPLVFFKSFLNYLQYLVQCYRNSLCTMVFSTGAIVVFESMVG